MKSKLQNLSELVARAGDIFESKAGAIDTLMGIMDKTLRNQGIPADAVTIDCIPLNKRIVILLHDDKPDFVSIALGNKEGDIYSSSEHELSTISETKIVEIMDVNFIS